METKIANSAERIQDHEVDPVPTVVAKRVTAPVPDGGGKHHGGGSEQDRSAAEIARLASWATPDGDGPILAD